MNQPINEYYEQRERAERKAAKAAACGAARRVHQQLAERYAELALRPAAVASPAEDSEVLPHLVILTRG